MTTIAEELFQVADAAAEVLAYARADDLQKPLVAIRKACDEAKRAWSGSNLGYHANVYWEGLQPKPPEVQFSPEWGLIRRLGVRESAPWAWCTMDREEVINAIISRASSPDIDSIDSTLAFVREKFSSSKARAAPRPPFPRPFSPSQPPPSGPGRGPSPGQRGLTESRTRVKVIVKV
jgi:hypothetical protein